MNPLVLLLSSMLAAASLARADGIPVDRESGTVTVPHSVISLTPEQIQETQILGTFTLTSEQWREIRVKSPECPKRFNNVIPVTYNDCCCGMEGPYVIALSRDRIAVLQGETRSYSMEMVVYELSASSTIKLFANERGEFHLGGKLIPFQTLLKALAATPRNAEREVQGKNGESATGSGRKFQMERWLMVELPLGAKAEDPVYESRLKQIADAADKAGIQHGIFSKPNN